MAHTVHDDLTSGGDFGGQPIGDSLKIRQISFAHDDECRDSHLVQSLRCRRIETSHGSLVQPVPSRALTDDLR
jgi:hypothetical protein